MLRLTTLQNAPRVPFNLDGRILISDGRIEIIQLCLKPGESIPRHSNDFDVIFYILEGEGVIETEAISARVTPGTAAEVDRGTVRGTSNAGTGDFRFLVVKIF